MSETSKLPAAAGYVQADAPAEKPGTWPSVPGYEILEEVGRGGMGIVYKARQVALDRIVALKMILPTGVAGPEQHARFLREAKVMALLQHPNVIQIHEAGSCNGRPFLAMEYVSGGSLTAKLAGRPMPPRKAAEMVAVLADAIQRAHQQGVIHRDLKPGNILLTIDGTPKIGDFGLAKWFAPPPDSAQTTQVMGTPSYMAPEQAFGPRPRWDQRSIRLRVGGDPLRVAHRASTLLERQSTRHAETSGLPGTHCPTPLATEGTTRPGNYLPEMPGKRAATPLPECPGTVR